MTFLRKAKHLLPTVRSEPNTRKPLSRSQDVTRQQNRTYCCDILTFCSKTKDAHASSVPAKTEKNSKIPLETSSSNRNPASSTSYTKLSHAHQHNMPPTQKQDTRWVWHLVQTPVAPDNIKLNHVVIIYNLVVRLQLPTLLQPVIRSSCSPLQSCYLLNAPADPSPPFSGRWLRNLQPRNLQG